MYTELLCIAQLVKVVTDLQWIVKKNDVAFDKLHVVKYISWVNSKIRCHQEVMLQEVQGMVKMVPSVFWYINYWNYSGCN